MRDLEQQAAKLDRVACERRLQLVGGIGDTTIDLGDSDRLRLPGAIITVSGGDRDAVEHYVDEVLRLACADHTFSEQAVELLREHTLTLLRGRMSPVSKGICVALGTDRIVENSRLLLTAIDAGIVDAAGLRRSLRRVA